MLGIVGSMASCRRARRGAARVEAERAGTERDDLEQSARDRDILEEMDHLVLVGEIAVEQQRRRDRERRQHRRRHARAVAGEQEKAEEQFDHRRADVRKQRIDADHSSNIGHGAGGIGGFTDSAEKKNQAEKKAPCRRSKADVMHLSSSVQMGSARCVPWREARFRLSQEPEKLAYYRTLCSRNLNDGPRRNTQSRSTRRFSGCC